LKTQALPIAVSRRFALLHCCSNTSLAAEGKRRREYWNSARRHASAAMSLVTLVE
jgi:hypothetical protein